MLKFAYLPFGIIWRNLTRIICYQKKFTIDNFYALYAIVTILKFSFHKSYFLCSSDGVSIWWMIHLSKKPPLNRAKNFVENFFVDRKFCWKFELISEIMTDGKNFESLRSILTVVAATLCQWTCSITLSFTMKYLLSDSSISVIFNYCCKNF